jgi:hypothetical protein
MELPGLNFRPSMVVVVEIHRKFGSPLFHDPSPPSLEFFLILLFGRCKFRLTEDNAAIILQPVLGVKLLPSTSVL